MTPCLRTSVRLFAAIVVITLTACSVAPPTARPTAVTTATPPSSVTPTPANTAQASPESLVYPIADGEEWILYDAPAADAGEPQPHDAIFLVRRDGTGLHRLVHEMTGSEIRATWSPDGSQVAYIQTRWPSDSWEDAGLYVVNADGSDPHRVYECSAWCNTIEYPDWGPDGAIYVSIDSNIPDPNRPPLTFEVWRIDPLTGDAHAVLTREDGMTVEQPRVSPDGTELVYARERIADGQWAIFRAEVNGRRERQLTDWRRNAAYPDWSPNGRVVFNTNDLRLRHDEPHHICTIFMTGLGAADLTCLETYDPNASGVEVEAAHARWTPDGQGMTYSLLLRGQPHLAEMSWLGSEQRLVEGPILGTFSELRPVAGS